jgi:hypothetical protein
MCYDIGMNEQEVIRAFLKRTGRMGAKITNKKLTTEGRSKAAKKGWRLRKRRLAAD